ncbi:unnamed protein product [Plutella xylostella]|uniref:(diamondback moth) hypothetical protein n=1 Tax=Plutella xylostella TaxID=51655 RepID=A0A8S4FNX8_PLUXY|nr:unnamed protein product [Plutella xylostella]
MKPNTGPFIGGFPLPPVAEAPPPAPGRVTKRRRYRKKKQQQILDAISIKDQNISKKDCLNMTCPICLDYLQQGNISSTLCGHMFCTRCIKKAVTRNNSQCPSCRCTLRGTKKHHPLYLDCAAISQPPTVEEDDDANEVVAEEKPVDGAKN